MTTARYDTTELGVYAAEAARGGAPRRALGGWLRLALTAMAVLALVAAVTLHGGTTADRAGLQSDEHRAAPIAQDAFDGYGKWGGYAR